MNRKEFIKSVVIGATALAVSPALTVSDKGNTMPANIMSIVEEVFKDYGIVNDQSPVFNYWYHDPRNKITRFGESSYFDEVETGKRKGFVSKNGLGLYCSNYQQICLYLPPFDSMHIFSIHREIEGIAWCLKREKYKITEIIITGGYPYPMLPNRLDVYWV